ncbi:GMC family oxidoreductase N-terminal domain-containing protein [Actinocorallia sp. API 0066]|uniref:GMC family oxidoreductase n=1 Tax=Actinocorallia sp. API 0066 TaxID=2896846 RepID=UPI001E41873B|nr:GMC family oxidoreductase N-terminal domain-containing protein [Actinocorallia sp. API 0066]MCD0453412.1 GMC family oxidoreductase N-terminal domain-containing protein [Actinocorallia sp. API 0066]
MRDPHYIIVGSGAAGGVLAGRLTEDPKVRVLLLESGRERRSPLLAIPAAETLLMGDPRYDWCFTAEPDATIAGRAVGIPRGRLLGGSNAMNGMIFVRGQRADYDGWAAQGNPGWSWNDVLPYFRRMETAVGLTGDTRGTRGPIRVGLPQERDVLCDAFLEAAVKSGHPENPDYNSGDQEGFGYYQVNHDRGRRSAALGGYLKPARRRPNLTVLTGAHVTRLTLDGTRCVGVAYRHRGRDRTASCTREVIVSAGTVQSPQLLELSGIGQADVLRAAGVSVTHHLPGVGENYRDHFAARLRWRVTRPITFNERSRGPRLARETARYLRHRRGLLSLPIALGHGFVRTAEAEPTPDVQFHFAPASYGEGATRRLDTKPGMTVGVYPLRPESAGSIHITSADPLTPPAIRPRYLESQDDARRLIAGMRIARSIVANPALDPYRAHELVPGPDVRSDDELLDYARRHGDTSYHPVGTCRMGADPMAVVDHRLRVHGVAGLRVVDASVMPSMVSGNTNAAAMMIGERGADLVLADLRETGGVHG